METKEINTLNGNAKNPRIIKKHEFNALKESILKFGDLSGIVFNVRSQQLVGGHQRIEAFKALGGKKNIIITHRFQNPDGTQQPNALGTIALGYVDFNNEQYGYREVDWDMDRELAANIAANRIQGEFDIDLLAQVTYELRDLNPDLLSLTGQTNDEIDRLINMVSGEPEIALPDGDKNGFQQMTFTISDEQAETINEALGHAKTLTDPTADNKNSNGSALFIIARKYLDVLHGDPVDELG